MRFTSFQTLADKYAKTMDGTNIKVTFSGTKAWATPTQVNLPSIKSGTILTQDEYWTLSGYLDHETEHPRSSDYKVLDEPDVKSDKVLMSLTNLFEDIRIENIKIARHPGSRKYLDHLATELDNSASAKTEGVMSLVYKEAYKKYRHIDTGAIKGELSQSFPAIAAALAPLAHTKSTQDCLDLARCIRPMLGETQNQQGSGGTKPGKQSGKSDVQYQPKGDEDEDQDRDESSQQDNPDQQRDSNSGPNQENANGEGDGDARQGQSGDRGEDNNSEDNDDAGTLLEQCAALDAIKPQFIQKLIDEINGIRADSPPQTGTLALPPAFPDLDKIFVPSAENIERYNKCRASASTAITSLKKQLSIFLMSRRKKAWSKGLETGTLDREALHRIPTGTTTVFKERRERRLINTAVQLMVDCSGSMDEETTRTATIILAETLAAIDGIKLSIAGFTTYSIWCAPSASGAVGRIDPMKIELFKDFDTPYAKCRPRLGAIRTTGSTPLGDAYGKALERIVSRPEPRRIIWIITDGKPGFNTANARHSDYILMDELHRRCRKLGIETIGLGIGHKSIQKYVDRFAFIDTITELPTAVLGIVRGLAQTQGEGD